WYDNIRNPRQAWHFRPEAAQRAWKSGRSGIAGHCARQTYPEGMRFRCFVQSDPKRIDHLQVTETLAMLQILGEQGRAASLQSRRDDQRIVEAQLPTLPNLQGLAINAMARGDRHQRGQDGVEPGGGWRGIQPHLGLSYDGVE